MTGIIITSIICGTILCVFGITFIARQRQKKKSAKVLGGILKTIFDEKESDRKAEKERKNADEKVLAEFDTFFKKIMKEGN